MRNQTAIIFPTTLIAICFVAAAAFAQQSAGPVRVTVDNFIRAETDNYFAKFVKSDGLGKFGHVREPVPIDRQDVIRMNRDTLYSAAVFDLDVGPVTITLPDAGNRYMAMQVINEDHYTPEVDYPPGQYTLAKEKVGTRYVQAVVRTFANGNDPGDLKTVHALQDAIKVEQKGGPGTLELPQWDQASLSKVRDAINALGAASGNLDSSRAFGRKDEVDPVNHLLGTAAGWGGNPATAAMYALATPDHNDGKTAYTFTVKDVPVDGFWSISVYNEKGFFEKNARDLYTFNNVTAKPNPDGSYTIRLGGDENATNYLPIMPGWNYGVRMYRPRKEILDGTWKFPEAKPVR